jgi:ComF family protein
MSSPVNFNPPLSPSAAPSPWPALQSRLRAAAAALWPGRCLRCAERGPWPGMVRGAGSGRDLCPACAAELPWLGRACPRCALPQPQLSPESADHPPTPCGRCLRRPPPQAATRAAFVYAPPLDALLPRLKFHGDLAAGRLLAQLMADALEAGRTSAATAGTPPWPDALIALPLHPARLRQRGYDQARELARPLARSLGLPLLDAVLHRQRATAAQSRLDAAARRRNLRGAFAVTAGLRLPAHIALVDDVMTTGATVEAAATALLRAGAQRVEVWVCARVP